MREVLSVPDPVRAVAGVPGPGQATGSPQNHLYPATAVYDYWHSQVCNCFYIFFVKLKNILFIDVLKNFLHKQGINNLNRGSGKTPAEYDTIFFLLNTTFREETIRLANLMSRF